MLATLFLLAIWVDSGQAMRAPEFTYAVIGGYIVFAAAMTLLTWSNWWLDARLAGPAHTLDISVFTLLVLITEGYSSPYFAFFMFVMLSAAIRWGWRATALTALLLALLYSIAGLLVISVGPAFELNPFLVRTGHLVILSLILMWFGATQRWTRISLSEQELNAQPSLDESPLEGSLRTAMGGLHAKRGLIVWHDWERDRILAMDIRDQAVSEADVSALDLDEAIGGVPFLYDLPRRRALWRDADRNLLPFDPTEQIPPAASAMLDLHQGLAIPLRSDGGDGVMFLEQVRGLSTDHLDAGGQAGIAVAAHIQRHRLLRTAEENAEARSRLTLARDLHDSVVQFLAGAAFRLEAMMRSNAAGRDLDPDLSELKQLMLQEQRELRSFITSLRSGPLTAFNDLAKELQALSAHLSRQWDVSCEFLSTPADLMIPTRLKLDAHQLVKEAVANAVRHASAKSVTVEATAQATGLRLEVINDGADFKKRGGKLEMPSSLRDRVEQAGGVIDLARGMGVTKLSISLPIAESGV